MADQITANLPSRDFAATSAFYAALGFSETLRTEDWMILECGALQVEFFAHPGLDPKESWFSACLRVDDLGAWLTEWGALGLPTEEGAIPRITGILNLPGVPRMFCLIDLDGSLWRILDNGAP